MSSNSKIEWTDTTWTVTTGCRAYSSGCANCYAERMSARLAEMARADVERGRDPGKKKHYALAVIDGKWSGVVTPMESALVEPLSWKRPRRVFVNSMSDLFFGDEADRRACEAKGIPFTPVPFEFIDRVFAVAAMAPHHTFQILTKRTGRMAEYFADLDRRRREWDADEAEHEEFLIQNLFDNNEAGDANDRDPIYHRSLAWLDKYNARNLGWPLPNVWLGTSIEDQKTADERIPQLLKCPAAVRFLSCEPLLGPVDLGHIVRYSGMSELRTNVLSGETVELCNDGGAGCYRHDRDRIDWVIVGGESGPGARPMHPDWARSIRDQCQAAGVAFFFKQWGAHTPHVPPAWPKPLFWMSPDGRKVTEAEAIADGGPFVAMHRWNKKTGDRTLDGPEYNEMPGDVRQAHREAAVV